MPFSPKGLPQMPHGGLESLFFVLGIVRDWGFFILLQSSRVFYDAFYHHFRKIILVSFLFLGKTKVIYLASKI